MQLPLIEEEAQISRIVRGDYAGRDGCVVEIYDGFATIRLTDSGETVRIIRDEIKHGDVGFLPYYFEKRPRYVPPVYVPTNVTADVYAEEENQEVIESADLVEEEEVAEAEVDVAVVSTDHPSDFFAPDNDEDHPFEDFLASDNDNFEKSITFHCNIIANVKVVEKYPLSVDDAAFRRADAEKDRELAAFDFNEDRWTQWILSDESTKISGGKYAGSIGYVVGITSKMVRVSIVGREGHEVRIHRRNIESGYCGSVDAEEEQQVAGVTGQIDEDDINDEVAQQGPRRSTRIAARVDFAGADAVPVLRRLRRSPRFIKTLDLVG
jgi:hypothetical protein